MATLTCCTQDSLEIPAVLPSVVGFTMKIVNISIPAHVSAKDVWQHLEKVMSPSSSRLLHRQGSYALYELNPSYLGQPENAERFQFMWVVQVQPPLKPGSKIVQSWVEETMLVHRAAREWVAVAEGGLHFLIDDRPVNMIKILQDGMQIQLYDLKLRFQDIEEISVTEELFEKFGKSRPCPFCGGPFVPGERMVQCPACGTPHHVECWNEYGGRCSGPTGCRCGVRSGRPEARR